MLGAMNEAISTRVEAFRQSTLFINAFYLMFSTFVVAASGFVFWVIIARTYSVGTVGLATTILSVSGLLSLLGLAGFDTTFVRFLPRAKRKDVYINSGLWIVTIVTSVLSLACAVGLPFVSPRLQLLHQPLFMASFVVFTVITSLNILTNAIFLAAKQARYIFCINALFSIIKVVLALVITKGSAMTIFIISGIAQTIGLLLSLYTMDKYLGHRFRFVVHLNDIRIIKRYSMSVYFSSILNLLPPTVLPLIVIHQLGPESSAFYYMAFTIASVLYTISYASMQSAFTEGSHNETALKAHVGKAARLIGLLLTPAMLAIIFLSNFILHIFGKAYSSEGTLLLQIFAISALPVTVYSALGAIFKVRRHLSGVVGMNIVYAVVILGLSYLLIPRFGVVAIGWAWLLGNVAAVVVGFTFLKASHGKT